jgi:hypothetical protein
LKIVPWGLVMTVPLAVPVLLTVSVYWETPAWLTVKACPATVRVPVLVELPELADTE